MLGLQGRREGGGVAVESIAMSGGEERNVGFRKRDGGGLLNEAARMNCKEEGLKRRVIIRR